MSPLLISLLLQTSDAAAKPDARYFQLPPLTKHTGCDAPPTASDETDDIIVCARPLDQRLPKLDNARFANRPQTATFRLLGANGAVAAEQRGVAGASAPAAMINLKWRFGRKGQQ